MQSRQAIMEEIRKTIARSERLYETAKAQHRGTIERALSGSGLGDVQKRSLTKTIAPANTGFRKGGVAANFIGNDSDGGVTHLPEQDYLHSSPKAADDLTDYFHTEDGSSSSESHLSGETARSKPCGRRRRRRRLQGCTPGAVSDARADGQRHGEAGSQRLV